MSDEKRKEETTKSSETIRAISQFSQIGITMASSVIVGVLIGKFLDDLLGTTPWLLITWSLLGAGTAIRAVFHISQGKK